jgi:hypothetical protein
MIKKNQYIPSLGRIDNAIAKGQKETQWSAKHYTEN